MLLRLRTAPCAAAAARACASAAPAPAVAAAPAAAPVLANAFAVVMVGGHQFKVSRGDVIIPEKLDADVGASIHLKKVLLVGSETYTVVGTPLLADVYVEAVVEEQALGAKAIVFKKRRRKNYRRLNGHRQPLTVLRIGNIVQEPHAPQALSPADAAPAPF